MITTTDSRTLGVKLHDGVTSITFWSPSAHSVAFVSGQQRVPLSLHDDGTWQGKSKEFKEGDTYKFLIDGSRLIPDPASLSQPQGVHGPSAIVDLSEFRWTDQEWDNPPLSEYIIYELHTGTFSNGGNFDGIAEHLDHVVALGITAIEIMPVAQFPGERNWGYDGVFPFAVQWSYGGARGLQKLVNTAHRKGLAVILDVVYNHVGPEGNYLHAAAPYFTEKYKTPWGAALNFDDTHSEGVRRYFIENTLMWFRDFHIDALRLDAVHAINDFGPKHILADIRYNVDAYAKRAGTQHYLIVESDLNDTCFIEPVEKGGYGMHAQWMDEFHHALRVTAGGEKIGYFSDFSGIEDLGQSYREAYVYTGQYSTHRGKNFGMPTSNAGHQFVVYSQNHDQVGNRMLGERIGTLMGADMQKLMAAAVMVSPFIPMLFMGEEWHEPHPFLYFVSHSEPELIEAVRKGRREEFAAFHIEGQAPDPNEVATFETSKLQWQILRDEPYASMLEYYKLLIRLRKTQTALHQTSRDQLHVETDAQKNVLILYRWSETQEVVCYMNFSNKCQDARPSSNVHGWLKILDSTSAKTKAPERLKAGVPGANAITIQPQSILIYANRIEE